ncbi:MAG: glutathione-dependent formaldehyde dehydrogenase [Ignavibacteria bacterium]|jgi:threonine dehydrogenase-like Zn-dependent dehydrogenase|nr:glutathione-dependent formaldehyde dehydrogenase [Ignavibacteria bacterium]MCU7498940.1 glutathione-dependent formaldehyde dehydrogenase [Ignavibacteria bacterium]MCU7513322.1 glutathione-dependent formaldehyde dehydrogenase [Ignavibacteria bacterium]MCU7521386.1 glutathione-dependent formaldehyde dehydrogenase [Ignavibacteria bacterium]MCU7524167.1 glutathione-dependent formaldehyde dehydrogenase [Ignavibacteria bacterium]
MKAVVFHGSGDIRVEVVKDPEIKNSGDAIIKVTSTAICGSDLHLYDGYIPTTEKGDIFGHEFMGEVVEKGNDVKKLNVGDRVVVPFPISCGECYYCRQQQYSLCDNSNPNRKMAEKVYGYSPAGIYGYSHLFGGIPGGQAEYVRVPYADVGPIKVNNGFTDEQVLFLSDIFPTGYMAAENCALKGGETVAVWGCGPVGQMTIQSLFLLGAGRVIAIDRVPYRLQMAERLSKAEVINYDEDKNVIERLKDMTGGRGPDCCIDAVGMESHGSGLMGFYDRAKQAVRLESDRPTALREAIQACRKGGVVSIPGVFGGVADKIPLGAAFNKGLTLKMGQTHVQKYMAPLLKMIEDGKIDPSQIITHRIKIEDAPRGYAIFRNKEDNCVKVVMKP